MTTGLTNPARLIFTTGGRARRRNSSKEAGFILLGRDQTNHISDRPCRSFLFDITDKPYLYGLADQVTTVDAVSWRLSGGSTAVWERISSSVMA